MTALVALFTLLAMSKMVRADYIEAIRALGEEPPASWTVPELKTRLAELEEELGIHQEKKHYTPLKAMMVEMNRASKKKADLQAFANQRMGINVNGKETIPILQRECVRKAYMMTTPTAVDPVGFGVHAALSYEEVRQTQPNYIQWVKTTAAEGQCDHRLARLAAWVNQMEEKEKIGYGASMAPVAKSMGRKAKSTTSAGSNSSTGSNAEVLQMLKQLQEEVAELRQERPRKKIERDDDLMSTPSSFDVVSQ